MTTQLALDGTEVPYPMRPPTPLSERQRQILAFIRLHGVVRPVEIGMLMHQGRERPCVVLLDFRRMRVGCCRHASSDGVDALRRLERRGLVRHIARGQWVPERHEEGWS